MACAVYLSLADIVHCSRPKRQPDILHLAGLQQIVTITALLLQLGLDSCHFLLQLSQLPERCKTLVEKTDSKEIFISYKMEHIVV